MIRTADPKPTNRFLILGTVFVIVAAMYFAQEVLRPIALAVLFSFLLAPLVGWLERLKLPRPAAVVLSVVLAFGLLGGIGFVVYNQLSDLTENSQQYGDNIRRKVNNLQGPGGILTWFHNAKEKAGKLLTTGPATQATSQPAGAVATATGTPPPPAAPMPVEVVNQQRSESPLAVAETVAMTVLGRAGAVFIVIVFTIFMLLQREDLRDRVIRLAGRDRLTTTTEALDVAAGRVSKYLLFQSIVNGSVGLVVFLLLWGEGYLAGTPFPSPAVWGLLAALLRFIPYVGIWISAALPVLLSLAVFQTFRWTFATLGVYVFAELVTANAIEPMLFGSTTGVGSLAVLVAAAFWAWLWGPVGLLLSTPLTVCLVVMGKYVPALEFLSILLSDEPALTPPDRVYQRLLALDQEEAADLMHEYAKTMPLEQLYDEVLLPALALAEADAQHGGLSAERRAAVRKSVAEIADELGDKAKADAAAAASKAVVDAAKGKVEQAEAAAAHAGRGKLATTDVGDRVHLPDGCVLKVVCLPAHDASDQLAATLFGQLLELRGYCVTVVSTEQLASEMVDAVETSKPDAVIVSALPPAAVTHARYLCKRLHGRVPEVEMIIGLWTATGDLARAKDRIACDRTVRLAGSLRAAIGQLHEILQPKLINTAMAHT